MKPVANSMWVCMKMEVWLIFGVVQSPRWYSVEVWLNQ